jgi:hypothetical protein
MRTHFALLFFGLLGLLLLVGCSHSGLDGVYPCTGVVTLNGTPLAEASLTFYPDGDNPDARVAGGATDEHGKYTVTTLKPGDGLFPGNYKVGVVKHEEYGPEGRYIINEAGEQEFTGRRIRNILPPQYEKPETSGLKATITKRRNTVNFDLTQ